jgi:hypothetical protein
LKVRGWKAEYEELPLFFLSPTLKGGKNSASKNVSFNHLNEK